MGQKQKSAFCNHCNSQVLAVGKTPNHILHLILTFFTSGVWAIVWIFLVIINLGGYRCTRCGLRV